MTDPTPSSSSARPGSATWSWRRPVQAPQAAPTRSAAIDVLAPGWSLPLIARMPEVRAGIEMPLGHGEFGCRHAAPARPRRCASAATTQAIVLPGSWKSALVPWFAGIPRRTGYRGEMRYGLLNDIRRWTEQCCSTTVAALRRAGARTARLTRAPLMPVPRLRVDISTRSQLMRAARPGAPTGPAVGLMPGAEYGPAKQWPVEYLRRARQGPRRGRACRPGSSARPRKRALGEQIRVAVRRRRRQPVRQDRSWSTSSTWWRSAARW